MVIFPVSLLDDKRLQRLSEFLVNPASIPGGLDPQDVLDFTKGILLSLAQDGSEGAVGLVQEFALGSPLIELQDLAVSIMGYLGSNGNSSACESLCELAMQTNSSLARTIACEKEFRPASNSKAAVFYILTDQGKNHQNLDPDFVLLTQGFFEHPELQEKIIKSARQTHQNDLEDWETIITLIVLGTPESLSFLVETFLAFHNPEHKKLCLSLLLKLSLQGNQAASEALCQIFILHGSQAAYDLASQNGLQPEQPDQKALYFLLGEQWQKYSQFDFDHRLLAIAYEKANRPLRLRIIDQVRRIGHVDWLNNLSQFKKVRWLGDLTDSDWEQAIGVISAASRWEDLWHMAQVVPSFWSAKILKVIQRSGWSPAGEDYPGFTRLCTLASRCSDSGPELDCRATLRGHIAEVNALAISDSRQYLASSSNDGTIRLWDLHDGHLRDTINILHNKVRSLVLSPDGDHLATGNDDTTIQIIRLSDHRSIKTLEGHKAMVRSLSIDSPGRTIISGSFDGSLRTWNFPFGPLKQIINSSGSEIFCTAITSDNQSVLSGSADGKIRQWSIENGHLILTLEGHSGPVLGVASDKDSLFCASSSHDLTVRIWNLTDGSQRMLLGPFPSFITSLVITENSQAVVCGGFDGSISIWNINTGKCLSNSQVHQSSITSLVISQDGLVIASGSNDRTIKLWGLENYLLVRFPIDQIRTPSLVRIQEKLKEKQIASSLRKWLEFTGELVQWRRRFDIYIEEPRYISVGEFDIEL